MSGLFVRGRSWCVFTTPGVLAVFEVSTPADDPWINCIILKRGEQMKILSGMLLTVVLGLSGIPVTAADWTSKMQNGGMVTVDPDTQRATVTKDGVTSPLWNGVHRMQDGSVLIVNQGEVVPGEPVDSPRQLPPSESAYWEGMPIVGYSPCERLTRYVCGKHDECASAEACNPSRQLLVMEQGERAAADDGSRMTYTSGQCEQAMDDDSYFSACRPANKQ
jgi:hypothetical protein